MRDFIKRLTGLLLLIAAFPIILISQPICWLICGKTTTFVEKYMDWINDKFLKL